MIEFQTISGAKVIINTAPFQDARNLWAAIEKAGAEIGGASLAFNAKDSLLNLIMRIDSSPEFNATIWPCLVRCLYNDRKVDKGLFEDVAIRKDYYEIIMRCAEENIRPFAESLFFELANVAAKLFPETKKPENSPA